MKMKTRACFFFLLPTACALTLPAQAAQSNDDQRWIEHLKTTPVGRIEADLPQDSFATWFAQQVKPAEAHYEVRTCEDTGAADEEKRQGKPLCVIAVATMGVRKLELTFIAARSPGREAAGTDEPRAVDCKFVHGSLGPSDPRMKFPTQVIRKLSDLEKLLRSQTLHNLP